MSKENSVLFVDDEEKVLRALQRDFLYAPYECFYVKSGKEALALLEERSVTVIVADMKMPEMDGIRLLQIVKERWPNTVRLVLTGYLYVPQMIAAINSAHIYQIITKPWGKKEEVEEYIQKAFEDYHAQKKHLQQIASLEARNTVCQNIVKKINTNIESSKMGFNLMKTQGEDIFTYLHQIMGEEMNRGVLREIVQHSGEIFRDMCILSSLDFVNIEMRELLDKIATSLDATEGVERVDVEYRHITQEKAKLKDGLIEYMATKLIGSMLPGVKKYIKIFYKDMGKAKTENLILIVSPVHRYMSDDQEVRMAMQDILFKLAENIMKGFGGSLELVNKGSKYLLHFGIPKYETRN